MTEKYSGTFMQGYKIAIANRFSPVPFSRDDRGFTAAIDVLRAQQRKVMPEPLARPVTTEHEGSYVDISSRVQTRVKKFELSWRMAEREQLKILSGSQEAVRTSIVAGDYAAALHSANHLHYRTCDRNLLQYMFFHAFRMSRDAHRDFWVHLMERFPDQPQVEDRRPQLEEIVENIRKKTGGWEIELGQYRTLREMLNNVALEGSVMDAAREWVDPTAIVGRLEE